MSTFDLDYETATDDEIAAYCLNPNAIFLGETCYDKQVVRLSNKTIVKFSMNIKEEEAKGQRRAYGVIGNNITRIYDITCKC